MKSCSMLSLPKENNVDAMLISCRYNRRYLTGYSGDTGYLYLSDKHQVLMTDSRYTTWARNESHDVEVFEVNASISYRQKVKSLLLQDHASSIGFEDTKMLFSEVMAFQKEIPEVKWVPLGAQPDTIRQKKTPEEQSRLRQSEEIADHAFSYTLQHISEGMTEIEVALLLENDMRKQGAEGLSFETIVASGINSAKPHAVPTTKKLEKGDFVTMDFGCIFEGYCSDMTRTIVMKEANEKQKEIYETVLCAQKTALAVIREGITGRQADEAARNVIAEAGYGQYFGHGLGHSVGLYIHEEPRLSLKDETILCEGMIETVEPGIYIPDFGGVRIEDMVIVRKDGCENLTHSPKELIVI